MLIYIVINILLSICSFISECIKGIRNSNNRKIINFILFVFFVLFVGLRGFYIGSDTITYKYIYDEIKVYEESLYHIEYGFFLLNKFVSLFGDFRCLLFLSAFISLYFLYRTIKYFEIRNVFFAYYSLFSSSFMYVYLFSGIRQAIAMGIILYSYRFINERKLSYYLFYVIVASFFHLSAIVTIPVYFITKKISFKYLLLLSLISLMFSFKGVTSVIFQFLISFISGHYASYSDSFSGFGNMGTGYGVILRIVLWLFLAYILSKHVLTDKIRIIYNIFCIGIIMYCFCLGVDILIRLSEYFLAILILVIPISVQVSSKNNKIISLIMIILTSTIFISILLFDDSLLPYKLSL